MEAAQSAGISLRSFAEKIGNVSASTLNRAHQVYVKYRNTPLPNLTLKELLVDIVQPREVFHGETVEPTVTTTQPPALQSIFPEPTTQTQLTYITDRTHELIECLHRYIRDGETHLAMRVASELSRYGDISTIGWLWNELQVCSNEEVSDPLVILAVDNLWHQVKDEEGRISSKPKIKERLAMIAAYLLAKAPKDRTSDDSFAFQRVLSGIKERLIEAKDTAEPLLQSTFEPTPMAPPELRHKGGKQGWEGNVHVAKIGSLTKAKTPEYAKFRAEFDRLLNDVLSDTGK